MFRIMLNKIPKKCNKWTEHHPSFQVLFIVNPKKKKLLFYFSVCVCIAMTIKEEAKWQQWWVDLVVVHSVNLVCRFVLQWERSIGPSLGSSGTTKFFFPPLKKKKVICVLEKTLRSEKLTPWVLRRLQLSSQYNILRHNLI